MDFKLAINAINIAVQTGDHVVEPGVAPVAPAGDAQIPLRIAVDGFVSRAWMRNVAMSGGSIGLPFLRSIATEVPTIRNVEDAKALLAEAVDFLLESGQDCATVQTLVMTFCAEQADDSKD